MPDRLWAPVRLPAGQAEQIVHEREPENMEVALTHQDGWQTPASRFYLRNHFAYPETKRWELRVEGEVERPFTMGLAELVRQPSTSLWMVLECSGNKRSSMEPRPEGTPWRDGAVGNAQWTGVPLAALLNRAGLHHRAVEVRFSGADSGRFKETGEWTHFERSLPLAEALKPGVLLAHGMNGDPLPRAHGGPVRLVVPRWYGMASVKWLVRIEVRSKPFRGPFQIRDYVYLPEPGAYDRATPVTFGKENSVITSPAPRTVVRPGRLTVRGLAWGGRAPLRQVETSLDGGNRWVEARLVGPAAPEAWRLWDFQIDNVPPGEYRVLARATNEAGESQPMKAPWNAKGYGNNAVAEASVTVTLRPTMWA